MIAHIRVPHFLARVIINEKQPDADAVVVHDRSRILGVSSRAADMDLSAGQFMDTVDIPSDVEKFEFDLDLFHEAQKAIRSRVQGLSPIAESLDLGEFLVEVDSEADFREWFQSLEHDPYPLTAALAPTGWLARIISYRLDPVEHDVVTTEEYDQVLQSVTVSEFWGLGNDIISSLKEVDLKTMGEIYHLDEPDLRKLIGKGSKVFHKLFEGHDPRPINVFSRPQSLSQELHLDDEGIGSKEELKSSAENVLKRFQEHLQTSASLAYRLTVTFFRDFENDAISHEFTTPTDDVEVFGVALEKILGEVTELDGLKISIDVVVGDVENYHADPQEDSRDLEILS